MKRLLSFGLPLAGLMTLVFCVAANPVVGKVTKGESRPLKTKTLMGAVVKAHCGAIGKGLKADEVDWDALHASAELLNESGHILMADGRCPDKAWADASKTLQVCSDVLVKKIEAKDAEGAQGAFGAMTKSCGACHSVHKPK